VRITAAHADAVVMTTPQFDAEGLFGDDYLYFFAGHLEERGDAETDLIWRLLELQPGMEVLDLACGHGRIANRLAGRDCRVTGLDSTELFLDHARRDAAAGGGLHRGRRPRRGRAAADRGQPPDDSCRTHMRPWNGTACA
jgi:SAM-dependent methyltransferase